MKKSVLVCAAMLILGASHAANAENDVLNACKEINLSADDEKLCECSQEVFGDDPRAVTFFDELKVMNIGDYPVFLFFFGKNIDILEPFLMPLGEELVGKWIEQCVTPQDGG